MTRENCRLIYVAPLLEHEFDLFKVGHTTIAGIKGRQSKLRRDLREPKLELYSIVDYPPDTSESTVSIHERQLVWMVRQRSVPLFEHATKFKCEVVYFPTTAPMRFWDETEPAKRDLPFRFFRRAFLLGDESGSSLPVPFEQVTSLLQQHRKQWERVKEVRLYGYSVVEKRERDEKEREAAERSEKARLAVWREQEEKEREAEERGEKARLANPKRIEAHGRIAFF